MISAVNAETFSVVQLKNPEIDESTNNDGRWHKCREKHGRNQNWVFRSDKLSLLLWHFVPDNIWIACTDYVATTNYEYLLRQPLEYFTSPVNIFQYVIPMTMPADFHYIWFTKEQAQEWYLLCDQKLMTLMDKEGLYRASDCWAAHFCTQVPERKERDASAQQFKVPKIVCETVNKVHKDLRTTGYNPNKRLENIDNFLRQSILDNQHRKSQL